MLGLSSRAVSASIAAPFLRASSSLARSRIPEINNEPMLNYAPGSVERKKLRETLDRMKTECPDIPCVVNGKEIRTGRVKTQVMPSNHKHTVANFHMMDEKVLQSAIDGSLKAKAMWEKMSLEDRASVFLKAADLAATKYRYELLASTMLGQGKNVWQAEIDSAAELIDFLRFNAKYAEEIYAVQPTRNSPGVWNRCEYRPLEGFVAAISPFNFTAIGANLCAAPAMMGNVVLWKPSETCVLSNWVVYKIFREAGLPDGVIQFLPGLGPLFGEGILKNEHLAGIHFTGSTRTFHTLWKGIAENLSTYRTFPRMVGETGGKNFHFVHPSADLDNAVYNTIRGSFEYSGQKCSATSRLYVPDTMWPAFREKLVEETKKLKVGQSDDFSVFTSAVIDAKSYNRIKQYIDEARASPDCEIIAGGVCDDKVGFFVQPTIILTKNPKYRTMTEEIFGPVLTVYVYESSKMEDAIRLVDESTPYALTGSIFAQGRDQLSYLSEAFRNSAGNFYVNDKSTGAVVGQQPFGGARASGTNDKAGSPQMLLRWVSTRAIKENFMPLTSHLYPSMNPDQ